MIYSHDENMWAYVDLKVCVHVLYYKDGSVSRKKDVLSLF